MFERLQTWRGTKIRDHRGRLLPLVSQRTLDRDLRMDDPSFKSAVIKALGEQKATPEWIFWLELFIYPVCVIGGTYSAIWTIISLVERRGDQGFVGVLVFGSFIAFAVAAVFVTRPARMRALARVVGHLLVEGICPTCTYSMRGLAAEADGCRVCPECGGAWQHTCIVRGHDFKQGADGANRRLRFRREASPFRRRRVIDARRQDVPVVGRRFKWAIAAAESPARMEQLRTAQWTLSKQSRDGRLALAIAAVTGWGAFGAWVGFADGAGHEFRWAALLLLLPAVPWAARFIWGNWGIGRWKTARILLRQNLCPSCLADVGGVSPGEDGVTVCPECEAAWRREVPLGTVARENAGVGAVGLPANTA